MALVNCKECGKEISDTVKTCPHCGFKKSQASGCFIVILIFLFILLISGLNSKPKDNFSETRSPNLEDMRQSAAGACMLFIKQTLHDPSSADFEHSSDAYIEQNSADIWTVQRKARAKNKFNATVLSTFECKMKHENDSWRAISINEL